MKLHPNTLDAYRLMHEGTLAFARAEQAGIRIDLEYAAKTEKELTVKITQLEAKLKKTKFFKHWEHTTRTSPNIYSNAQLAAFLYKTKKIKPVKTTTSGGGSTDEEALNALNITELNDLLTIRKLKKVRDTYLVAFQREQVDGYIHPSFSLNLVRTFRSSSQNPNFQNIPKRDKEAMTLTRKALYPRPGYQLLEVDYSGLEVRIAACYHKDKTMLKYIKDPTTDMHADMAAQIFKVDNFDRHIPEYKVLRDATKNAFVFPQFYGSYYGNCAENLAGPKWGQLPSDKWKKSQGVSMPGDSTLGAHMIENDISSMKSFTEHIKHIEEDFWGNRFREYARWKEKWWKAYQKKGYIHMLSGFTCGGVMGKNDCINYPVQGAAFHCLLWSFIELDRIMRKEEWKTRLVGQIHDAIILDVHPKELKHVLKVIKRVTCKDLPDAWRWINVPLDVEFELCDVDTSWADKKELENA